MNTVIVAPEVLSTTHRSAYQQYWDGFQLYCDCAIDGEWPNEDALASLTVAERQGYEAAAKAEAEAEYDAWCQQESADYADYRDEVEWLRRGC